jgi:hypothetical protein
MAVERIVTNIPSERGDDGRRAWAIRVQAIDAAEGCDVIVHMGSDRTPDRYSDA